MSDEDSPLPPSEIVQSLATREDYAEAIRGAYRDTVEGIFRMGSLLIEAKEELPHGEFGPMVEEDLPFGERTARKLRTIARDERLRNRTKWSDLPPAWTTLHRLAKLDDGEWERVEPHLSPDLTGSEIPDLVERGAQLPIMTDEARSAQERVDDALRELPYSRRRWVRERLDAADLSPGEAARVAKTVAEIPGEKLERLMELGDLGEPPSRREEEDVQIALPGFAAERREDLLEEPPADATRVEGARSAMSLNSLLGWALALRRRTTGEDLNAGRWVLRSPGATAEKAREVAEWLREAADDIEDNGPS